MRFALVLLATSLPLLGGNCSALSGLKLRATTITSAQTVAAGAFIAPGPAANPLPAGRGANPFAALPAFCRVAATLTPSADSDIKIEVWLPETDWNGKFEAVGNGGWAGTITYPQLAVALRNGYATASTDTGHATQGASFAMGHPEKLADFGYRAVHEMTTQAKALIEAFYATPAKRSYWTGCSTGGRQGLMSAQRYPSDFDGIVAGAPANYMSHLQPWDLSIGLAVHETEASYIPSEKWTVIHKAVLDQCDALDGVKDGVLENPRSCHFDPKVLQCENGDAPTCLTAPQVTAARKLYADLLNPRTGIPIFPGLEPGSEMGWGGLAGPQPLSISLETFRYLEFENPKWDFKTIDFDRDTAFLEKKFAGVVDAISPDLSAFMGRGGKLIMYHGWNDQLIAPRNSIDFFRSVLYMFGAAKTMDHLRLYMVPGMNHCNGGDGTTNFDAVGALDRWVEQGQAPDVIVASRKNPDRTRPLCTWPKVAVYSGSGSTDDAANFTCRVQ